MAGGAFVASLASRFQTRFCFPGTQNNPKIRNCRVELHTSIKTLMISLRQRQRHRPPVVCRAGREPSSEFKVLEEGFISDKVLQFVLYSITGVYVLWLFILPYAPGDPAWAIDAKTLSMLLDLSLNFFLILPLLNAAGLHIVEAPVLHPTSEALFNLVMGWTLLFGPMIFSDQRSNRFKGPLEALWLGQWLLTNTFLAPYMAIRLNPASPQQSSPPDPNSGFLSATLSGSKYLAATGAAVGVLSLLWSVGGRGAEFGDLAERWKYFSEYVGTDRVGYAFVWDLILYSVFQPWLIASNLTNIKSPKLRQAVQVMRFVPLFGLAFYVWGLEDER